MDRRRITSPGRAAKPGWRSLDARRGLTVNLDERRGIEWEPDRGGHGDALRAAGDARARSTPAPAAIRAAGSIPTTSRRAATGSMPSVPPCSTPGLYYADGQQRDEVYTWGSFLQSRMHAAGVTCADCHEPHSGKLRASGNAVCAQCHASETFDTPAHHHHATGSAGAECVACHMPATTYMVIDPAARPLAAHPAARPRRRNRRAGRLHRLPRRPRCRVGGRGRRRLVPAAQAGLPDVRGDLRCRRSRRACCGRGTRDPDSRHGAARSRARERRREDDAVSHGAKPARACGGVAGRGCAGARHRGGRLCRRRAGRADGPAVRAAVRPRASRAHGGGALDRRGEREPAPRRRAGAFRRGSRRMGGSAKIQRRPPGGTDEPRYAVYGTAVVGQGRRGVQQGARARSDLRAGVGEPR